MFEISKRLYRPKKPPHIKATWYTFGLFPRKNSIKSTKRGYEKTSPIPTAIEFNSIDSNIVTQWIAKRGPRINPGLSNSFRLKSFLITKVDKNSVPKKVLIPTSPMEEISEVLIINGIVPQEIANITIPE